MRLIILGSLGYHDETILSPIKKEAMHRGLDVRWKIYTESDKKGSLVHLEDCTNNTIHYWRSFLDGTLIEENDRILIADFWNPMIFSMKFYATRKFKNVKFFTIHHGSSDLYGDFAAGPEWRDWASKNEYGWDSCYDGIFFGSETTRTQYLTSKGLPLNSARHHVTYLPISEIERMIGNIDKTNITRVPNTCIMPLRPDYDKGADLFFEYAKLNPHMTFKVAAPFIDFTSFHDSIKGSIPKNVYFLGVLPREELFMHELSSEYVCSFARQETFGYAVLEAILCGCKPILEYSSTTPYKELYDECISHNKSFIMTDKYQALKFSQAKIINLMTQ